MSSPFAIKGIVASVSSVADEVRLYGLEGSQIQTRSGRAESITNDCSWNNRVEEKEKWFRKSCLGKWLSRRSVRIYHLQSGIHKAEQGTISVEDGKRPQMVG